MYSSSISECLSGLKFRVILMALSGDMCALKSCGLENSGAISPKPQMISSGSWTTNCYQYGNSKNLIWRFGNVKEMHPPPLTIQLDTWRSRFPLFVFFWGKSVLSSSISHLWSRPTTHPGPRTVVDVIVLVVVEVVVVVVDSGEFWMEFLHSEVMIRDCKGHVFFGPKDHLTLQWNGLNLHSRSVLVPKIASF